MVVCGLFCLRTQMLGGAPHLGHSQSGRSNRATALQLCAIPPLLCSAKKWGEVEFPLPFGRTMSPQEEHVHSLDEATGASLKLSILNPKGRIWTMVAGGLGGRLGRKDGGARLRVHQAVSRLTWPSFSCPS